MGIHNYVPEKRIEKNVTIITKIGKNASKSNKLDLKF